MAVRICAPTPAGQPIGRAARSCCIRPRVIWDAATGKEIAVLRGHEDRVWSAIFSPDGSRIVTASLDKTARVWDVHFATMSTQKLMVEVCTRRLRGLTTLSRDEMRLAGYSDLVPEIDVCADVE